ncbi:flavin-containing monooxygenase [Curtobacterium sp. L1-20]|uniref:flavin-containing monooxygenase n=1 Tax=Curtobacterium sp. L1-20 TaxID=3138181 RepID=UPI003B524DA0
MTDHQRSRTRTDSSVLIIGAGPGGIAVAERVADLGIDFVVVERAAGLGGTWYQNRYPGVGCDVPAHYYSYSTDPNAAATTLFASGAELRAYFEDHARRTGVAEHVVHDTEVTDLDWEDGAWTVTSADGQRTRHRAVVGATGRLNRAKVPDIAGLDRFAGVLAHSSDWDPSEDLAGKRVAVVGTGSSGAQIVSALAGTASTVTVFQRTASWVMPVPNEPIPEELRAAMLASPERAREQYRATEAFVRGIAEASIDPDGPGARARDAQIRAGLESVADPALRRALTPDYAIGCKRIVFSGTFLTAVQRPDVQLVTSRITEVEPTGVRTADGALHEADVLILATGFHADNYLRPIRVRGADGITLDELWADSFLSYKSVALPEMPNLFLVNGPYTPGGSTNVLAAIEEHAGYVVRLVEHALTEHVAVRPDTARTRELLEAVRAEARRTVWATGGCDSWYLDASGTPLVSPMTIDEVAADLREVAWGDLVVTPV